MGNKMKLYILGLDGLDFDSTLGLGTRNLLQEQFGKMKVPISRSIGCPSSPEVWASFLCGEHIKKGFEGRRNMWALNLLQYLKRRLPFISFGIGQKVCGRTEGFKKLGKKTWIDNPNVEEIGVPYYSYTNKTFQLMRDFEKDKDLTTYRRRLYCLFLEQTAEVISKTRTILKEGKNIDITFAYIHFPDLFHHVWFTDKDELEKYYWEINEFAGRIKSILKNMHVLIISDHGFDFTKNTHSNFGFISSNKKMTFPKTIIELGKQIEQLSEKNMGWC